MKRTMQHALRTALRRSATQARAALGMSRLRDAETTRLFKLVGTCVVLAITAGAAVSTAPLLASEKSVLTGRGISASRADATLSLQRRVAETHLPSTLAAALGSAYAGVWFEPAAARFHIGVTSRASALIARRVVAQAGLSGSVVETPVRSTWSALVAAQERWNRRVAQLTAASRARTGIDAARNAVSVGISPTIAKPEHLALEQAAAHALVNVNVGIEPLATFAVHKQAKKTCESPFVSKKARCEETITSGVRIVPEGKGGCTAGPMLIEGNETFMLTAGHCFGKGDTNKPITIKVTAEYPSGGGALEVGKEGTWFEGHERDIAEVKVKRPGPFTEALPDPVPALVTEWSAKPATPHAVEGIEAAIASQILCHQGQTSGEQCGEVLRLNVLSAGTDHLVETNACAEEGDSGGPYFFKSTKLLMVGVHVAGTESCPKTGTTRTFFEPLLDLTTAKGFGVLSTFSKQQLLTTANEVRAAGPLWNVNGKSLKAGETRLLLATAKEKFTLASTSITVECTGINLPEAARMQIVGAGPKTGGSSNETIEFTTCTQSGNGASCTVTSSKFTSASLVNTLGYSSATRNGPVLVLFLPEVGTTFATVKFSGLCTQLAVGAAGSVIGVAQIAGTPVAVGSSTETLHGEVNFTASAKTIWTESAGSLKETKAKLELAGLSAKFTGIALLLVDEGGSPVNWGIFS